MIFIEKSFLDKETCSVFLNLAKQTEEWEGGGHDFWANRVLHFKKIFGLNNNIQNTVVNKIRNFINIKYNTEVYCDTIDIIRWTEGLSQPPHIDACEGLEYRDYGCIIYLNDDYEGGHTYYPDRSIDINPISGMIVVHPGSEDYYHGVTEVKNNVRYTIASFWTTTKEKANYDRIY